ncbi:MAG: hypothetical protein CMQ46_11790 [Gammaproteobacteria bacterium]|nr:hypothetical protein [Gammaproteobacteria bacterium]MBJ55928.1 hypothetical protein [Gammaproteobacteria bacterium]HBN15944.1 ATP-binding protein [Pseudohongiella sp.]
MMKVILVCGPTGAGKTTYSIKLAEALGAVRFSIDPWMQNLYSKDMKNLDYSWILERVERCYKQIWEVSEQVLQSGGSVIWDLGFAEKSQRDLFVGLAKGIGAAPEIHYLDAPVAQRKERVRMRNINKDPKLYSFEVSTFMFEFMEPKFEVPAENELQSGKKIETGQNVVA